MGGGATEYIAHIIVVYCITVDRAATVRPGGCGTGWSQVAIIEQVFAGEAGPGAIIERDGADQPIAVVGERCQIGRSGAGVTESNLHASGAVVGLREGIAGDSTHTRLRRRWLVRIIVRLNRLIRREGRERDVAASRDR